MVLTTPLAVVIDDGGVFNGNLMALRQIVENRAARHDLAGLHIQRKQVDGVLIIGKHHEVRRGVGRAAAAHARPPPVVLSPSPLTFAPTLSYGVRHATVTPFSARSR